MIYGHGDDLYRYEGLVKANFSSNIYQHADLEALKRHLAGRLDIIGNYPEPAPLSLEKAIAEFSNPLREIYQLSLQGKSNEEIARELNLTLDSVKSHKKRGKQALKDKLKDLYYFLSVPL